MCICIISLHQYICAYVFLSNLINEMIDREKFTMDENVLSTPGHLISLAARSFARLSESRLKPLGFGVGQLPVLIALQNGNASTQGELARFAKIGQPPMAQMLTRMERDGLIERTG